MKSWLLDKYYWIIGGIITISILIFLGFLSQATIEIPTSRGFWITRHYGNEKVESFYCPDGSYSRDIKEGADGWWEIEIGRKHQGSYMDYQSAVNAAEKIGLKQCQDEE